MLPLPPGASEWLAPSRRPFTHLTCVRVIARSLAARAPSDALGRRRPSPWSNPALAAAGVTVRVDGPAASTALRPDECTDARIRLVGEDRRGPPRIDRRGAPMWPFTMEVHRAGRIKLSPSCASRQ